MPTTRSSLGKNVLTGTNRNQRFRSDEGVEEVYLEKKDFQFPVRNRRHAHLRLDQETYDQIELSIEFAPRRGPRRAFFQDGMKALVQHWRQQAHRHRAAGERDGLTVTEADAVMRGGTAAPSYKGAVLENGMKTQVPPFIEAGEKDYRRDGRRLCACAAS